MAAMLAYFFLALALVGIFIPCLPTVPFLLLTAWFAARGSDRLHAWLYAHPHLGKLIINWEQQGAISRTSKVIAVAMLIISWIVIFFRMDNVYALAGVAVLFSTVAAYLISRPEPYKDD